MAHSESIVILWCVAQSPLRQEMLSEHPKGLRHGKPLRCPYSCPTSEFEGKALILIFQKLCNQFIKVMPGLGDKRAVIQQSDKRRFG